MTGGDTRPVLILGAGINGACVARELAINGVPVVIADRFDIATGATAKSSRLIHGGLRYLEYGDVGLVRESLAERSRLLRLAPQYVAPLRIHIPIRRRTGGLLQSGLRFLKFDRFAAGRRLAARIRPSERGLVAVRIGLWLYDRIARASTLPTHAVRRAAVPGLPRVDGKYRWLCAYSDAQILYPERFTLALLADARRAAARCGALCDVLTYHRAEVDGEVVRLIPERGDGRPVRTLRPSTIVNATGAWGDFTLAELHAKSSQLFAGTKGSHIITRHPALRAALGGDAVYAEAADGRLVFVLPFGESVLIGTTDERFPGRPEQALADADDVAYFVGMVNEVFGEIGFTAADIDARYCGVRPLPNVNASRAGAIPRGHWIETNTSLPLPIDTLIGGKLTTCRAFGEAAADRILERLGVARSHTTRDRPLPGAEGYPAPELMDSFREEIAHKTGLESGQVRAACRLMGASAIRILEELPTGSRESIPGTHIPVGLADWIIEHEWVRHVCDLVERRLMLAWEPGLSAATLAALARRMAAAGRILDADISREMAEASARLRELYGRSGPRDGGR